MSNPPWITADVAAHLADCPPWDQGIPESLIPELAQTICERFNYTPVYDQLDELACALLRERGMGPGDETDQPA
jgi:hypothetical protein